jgi:hypothetical protein
LLPLTLPATRVPPSPGAHPLMGEGLGGGAAAKLGGDGLRDAVEICQDLVVPKPQNAIALVLQELISLDLPPRRGIMLATVDFHDRPDLVAHKIGNVAAGRHLPAKFEPHAMRAPDLPDPPFRLGHALP